MSEEEIIEKVEEELEYGENCTYKYLLRQLLNLYQKMSIDWKDLQYSFKQLHISLTDVQNKEIEMQKILSSSLNLYYKYKRKILLYINNIQGFMGLNKNIFYQDTIKVKVEGANKDDIYIFGPLKTYLLLFRNNFGNLFKFLNYLKPEEFGKIALLLTHFFYEDITLNESSDALNYIYFHLLSNELNNFCDSYFLLVACGY